MLSRIEWMLEDDDALRAQLESGQRAEREKLERIAAEAAEAAQDAERAAKRATQEFADATDDDERDLLKDAAMVKRADAKRERARADAALDALNDEAAPDPKAAARSLRERIAEAGDDVRLLNAALREGYEALALFHEDGGVRIIPALLADELEWLLSEPTADGTFV